MDCSGNPWLQGLIGLSRGANRISLPSGSVRLVDGHKPTWGRAEMALPAPLALLEYLIENIAEEDAVRSRDTGLVRSKRLALARRDQKTVMEGLSALRSSRLERQWFVLEGRSRPDATFEMPEAVLVIEGKRTERRCTSKTKWMGTRSQLLRHMDAALEYFSGKEIFGLVIVEGDEPNPLTPSQHWHDELDAQRSTEMLAASLPHRSPHERSSIGRGVLGVITWQAVCKENRIPWPPDLAS